jgi:hypothetical protein
MMEVKGMSELERQHRLKFRQPESRGHGQKVTWQVHDPDGTVIRANLTYLSDAMDLRRLKEGRWIQLVLVAL